MRVVVTGGLGVNGAWVVRRLVELGHTPVVADARPDYALVADLRHELEVYIGDVTDPTFNQQVLDGADCVAHLAAVMPDQCQHDPALAFRVNVGATAAVLESAVAADVARVVFTSSKGAYAPFTGTHGHPDYRPIPEEYPREPIATARMYGASKVFCEDLGRTYAERYGLDFIALRFSSIYGPGKQTRMGARAAGSMMIENAVAGRPTHIERGYDQRDDMVYVKDVAQGIVAACTAEKPRSWVYNIGSGRTRTLADVADAVRTVVPGAEITIGPGLDHTGFGPIYGLLDITRAQTELGYSPAFDVPEGVADYVDALARMAPGAGDAAIHRGRT